VTLVQPSTRPVRLIGVPSDVHSSYARGAAAAPPVIRHALLGEHGNMMSERGYELGVDIPLEDAGDLALQEQPGDDDVIAAAVKRAVEDGTCPLLLGGDHAITVPIVAALAAIHGPIEILHIDAHPDLYDEFQGDRRSHACPFARIMEAGHARRLVQVGIRTLNRHNREQAQRFGVEMFEMRRFDLARVPELTGRVYVTIDLDGLDPSVTPGVAHPEPGGLTVREVLGVLDRVRGTLVGADIVELNPARDINGASATVCAKLVKELAALSVSDRT
jgi:agmatinase